MRVIVALLIVLAAPAAHANTVWNVKVATPEGTTQLRSIDGNPNVTFPACRCVAGRWRLRGETTTHFAGTLDVRSVNHPRKRARTLRVKVRKTRALMSVHGNYREALHGIVRGTGSLVLREVAGGEWEVAAFADAAIGDVFAKHANWRSTAKRPAKPAPVVDPRADAVALAKLINDYRAELGLPRVPISRALTEVARAHVRDLGANPPGDRCNLHSWSKHGAWSACCYDNSRAAARCMWKKPEEIAGYKSSGYEIAATASAMTPEHALSLWQNSSAHDAIMSNKKQWTKPWRALGVAIEGNFAVAWFGEAPDR